MLCKSDSVQWWKRCVKGAGVAGLVVAAGLVAATPARADRAEHPGYRYPGGWGVYVSPGYSGPYYPYSYSYSYPYYYYGPGGYYPPPSIGFGFSFR